MRLTKILDLLKRLASRKEMTMPAPPPINSPTISPENQKVLLDAYQMLMDNRESMIDRMQPMLDSPYRRGVVVDSIISGLMTHFHEFARNESVHGMEIGSFGGNFREYVRQFIQNMSK